MDGPIGKRWPAYAHWIDDGTNMFGNVDNTWVNNVVIDSPNTQDQACHNIFIPLDYTGPAANAGLRAEGRCRRNRPCEQPGVVAGEKVKL